VLHAADDLLAERGFAGVTIEGIAARAGVAKQTIYRWWPSKVEVLLDTLIEDSAASLAVPDTGSAIEDTRQYLRRLAGFITGDPAGKVLLALIGEAQHDPAMADHRLQVLRDLIAGRQVGGDGDSLGIGLLGARPIAAMVEDVAPESIAVDVMAAGLQRRLACTQRRRGMDRRAAGARRG